MFCLEIMFLGPLAMSLLKISKRKDPFCYCFFIVKEREEQGDGVACEQNNQFQIYLAYQCFFNAKYFSDMFGDSSWWSLAANQSSGVPVNHKSQ